MIIRGAFQSTDGDIERHSLVHSVVKRFDADSRAKKKPRASINRYCAKNHRPETTQEHDFDSPHESTNPAHPRAGGKPPRKFVSKHAPTESVTHFLNCRLYRLYRCVLYRCAVESARVTHTRIRFSCRFPRRLPAEAVPHTHIALSQLTSRPPPFRRPYRSLR